MIKSDLGAVTAYADAVAHGYTGTREDFGKLLAGAGQNLADAAAAKDAAEAAADNAGSAAQTATDAAGTAGQAAGAATNAAGAASTSAEAAAQSAEAAETAQQGAENAAKKAVEAKTGAENALKDADTAKDAASGYADAATESATAAEASATNAADSAKSASDAAQKIEDSAEKIKQNADDVSQLKEDTAALKDGKISKFYASSQGNTNLPDSDSGRIVDLKLYGKSSQDGTPTPDNPVEIKSVVNPVVTISDGADKQQTATLPYTLNAIHVSSGGNVTIAGQQYIADYVDVEKGKLYRKVKRLDLKDIDNTAMEHGFHSNGNGYLAITIENAVKNGQCISNKYEFATWTQNSGYLYIPNNTTVVIVDDRFTDKQTAIGLIQDVRLIYELASPIEDGLSTEQIKSLKSLSTYHPVTNITVSSEELDGYAVFNYPVSMANGWNYVKQQLSDNRDYIYDMDLQSAEAYVNSEYAVALTELEV